VSEEGDLRLWESVIDAQRELIQRRAEFNHAEARTRILGVALARGDGWHRRTALEFLSSFSTDVPALVDQLVDIGMSTSWARAAREALAAGDRSVVLPEMERVVAAHLPDAVDDDYRRLAEILVRLEAWRGLTDLVRRARAHVDADVREVGADFTERYGPMLAD